MVALCRGLLLLLHEKKKKKDIMKLKIIRKNSLRTLLFHSDSRSLFVKKKVSHNGHNNKKRQLK
jgi:hypothetical protein